VRNPASQEEHGWKSPGAETPYDLETRTHTHTHEHTSNSFGLEYLLVLS
jgi:hypothetical protein